MSGHWNERRSESGDKLAMTSWASSKYLDTADRQRNTGQQETDVLECRGTWTSWGVVAADHSLSVMMMIMIMHWYIYRRYYFSFPLTLHLLDGIGTCISASVEIEISTRVQNTAHRAIEINYDTVIMLLLYCALTGRFTFSIDSILSVFVVAPWDVNNPCPRRLSPVANSVVFFGLPLPFFPGSQPSNTVLTKEPWRSTCPNNLFCLFLKLSMSSLFAPTVFSTSSFFVFRPRYL